MSGPGGGAGGPARLVVPLPGGTRSVTSLVVTPALLASDELAALTGDGAELARRWTAPGARLGLHVTPELVAVTRRDVLGALPVAVVIEAVPRRSGPGPCPPRPVIAAACRHHRVPVALWVGADPRIPVRGLRVPTRWWSACGAATAPGVHPAGEPTARP